MNQLFTWMAFTSLAFSFLYACNTSPNCQELTGRWTNHEGQDFVFQPGGQALLLVKFGSSFDTARFSYRLDCSRQPATLDLDYFQGGLHAGKTLFGIIEWSSDSSFRLRYEAGSGPDSRPAAFDTDQTQKFFKGN
jgi:hypothetical protein